MLPLSLRPPSSAAPSHADVQSSFAWFSPSNIAAAQYAEFRTLIVWLAIFVAVGVGIALAHVWLRLKVVDVGYRLSTTRQVIHRLEQEEHELTVEAATLDTTGRIVEVARARLGMMRPPKGSAAVLP